MNQAWVLMFEFFKTGLFAIGGGPATIPFLMEMAEKYPWFTMQELSDMIAISESTPGPIGLNMATYAGFRTLGVFGGILSTIALVIPSIVIIIIIAKFLEGFQENRIVKAVFAGIKPAVTALIASAVIQMIRVSLFREADGGTVPHIQSIVLCVVIFLLLQWKKTKKMHPALWFLIAAVIGVVFQF
ncbi:MAG: chromate transporter [Lachnospiraceae bacterium]|nr:chromate transporter [Lachnospiraceae bacterium]